MIMEKASVMMPKEKKIKNDAPRLCSGVKDWVDVTLGEREFRVQKPSLPPHLFYSLHIFAMENDDVFIAKLFSFFAA